MSRPLHERIQDLLLADNASLFVSLGEMVGWVHAREGRFFGHEELVEALTRLHAERSIRSEGFQYAPAVFDDLDARPLTLPTPQDLERAKADYLERINRWRSRQG